MPVPFTAATSQGTSNACGRNSKSMTDTGETVIVFKERAGKPGGGKGILIWENAAFTLATENCDRICYEEPVTKPETGRGTQERLCGAFMGGQGPKARTIAYSEKISPSLKSVPSGGNTIPDVVYPINTMVAVRGGRDDMRTCFGVGEPGDPQFTISAAHSHAVCYQETVCLQGNLVDRNVGMNGIGVSDEGVSYTLNEVDRHAIAYRSVQPDRVFQNTGHGWWTESTVCETVRTPCGGDSMKANLIVEVLDGEE